MQTSFQAWPNTKPQVNQFRNAETIITVICLPSSPLFLPVVWLSLNSWPRCNSRMNPNGLAQKMVECPYDEMHCARANCKKQKQQKEINQMLVQSEIKTFLKMMKSAAILLCAISLLKSLYCTNKHFSWHIYQNREHH